MELLFLRINDTFFGKLEGELVLQAYKAIDPHALNKKYCVGYYYLANTVLRPVRRGVT